MFDWIGILAGIGAGNAIGLTIMVCRLQKRVIRLELLEEERSPLSWGSNGLDDYSSMGTEVTRAARRSSDY